MRNYDNVARFGFYGLATEAGVPSGGDVFYVDSNSGNAANTSGSGQGDSWDLPFATVNYAISRCSNGANNVIFVAQHHAETIADTNDSSVSGTTTDEFCVDKSEVTIIGLGEGSARPTFTLNGAADAKIDVQAANCRMCNLIFYNTQDGNAVMLDAQASADGLVLENCMFYTSANDAEPIQQIVITASTDDVVIRGCRFYNVSGGDQILSAIKLEGAALRCKIIDNVFRGDWNNHVIEADAAQGYDVEVIGNTFDQQDATVGNVISLHAATTGVITDNVIHCLTGTGIAILSGLAVVDGNTIDLTNQGPNHFYVDSGKGVATNDGKSWATAVTTIDLAVGLAQADNGDIIHVAAGHSETLTGAATHLMDIDVNDLHIIGEGQAGNRPEIDCDTLTDGVVEISADNITMENIIFRCSTDDMAYLVRVDGVNCTLKNCLFTEDDQVPLTCITVGVTTDALADGLTIEDCQFLIPTADDGNTAISILKDMDNVTIKNCVFRGDWDDAVIDILAGANASLNLSIEHNIMVNTLSGAHCIQISGQTCTGQIINNTLVCDDRFSSMTHSLCQVYGNKWSKYGKAMAGIDNVDQNCAGTHFFVNSVATDAGTTADKGYSWAEPCSTIVAALALCTNDLGDVIHVAPGHNESLGAAQQAWNKNGVTVIGHGQGDNRPRIDFDNAAASIDLTGDGMVIKGLDFLPSAPDVLIGIHINDGCTDTLIQDCRFLEGETGNGTDEFVESIQIGAGDHKTIIEDCIFRLHASCGGATYAVLLKGASNEVIVRNNIMTGPYATACIGGDTTLSKEVLIQGNILRPTDTNPGIKLLTGTTGIVCNNYISTNLTTTAAAIAADAVYMFANLYCEVVTETGGLIGTESAND